MARRDRRPRVRIATARRRRVPPERGRPCEVWWGAAITASGTVPSMGGDCRGAARRDAMGEWVVEAPGMRSPSPRVSWRAPPGRAIPTTGRAPSRGRDGHDALCLSRNAAQQLGGRRGPGSLSASGSVDASPPGRVSWPDAEPLSHARRPGRGLPARRGDGEDRGKVPQIRSRLCVPGPAAIGELCLPAGSLRGGPRPRIRDGLAG